MIQEFYRPRTAHEAAALKARHGDAAVFFAGGTALASAAVQSDATIAISVADLGLEELLVTPQELTIGAAVTLQQLIEHPELPEVLKDAARQMVNRNIRNLATIGGNIGLNRSCATMIPALCVLDARVAVADTTNEVERSLHEHVRAPGGGGGSLGNRLITRIIIPGASFHRGVALQRHARTQNDLAIINVAVSTGLAEGRLRRPLIAVGGVAPHVVRLTTVEEALDGEAPPARAAVEPLVTAAVTPIDDLRGSAAFKRRLAAALVADCLTRAVGQLSGARAAGQGEVTP